MEVNQSMEVRRSEMMAALSLATDLAMGQPVERYDWSMRRSGVPGASEFLHVFTVRDGKVCRWRGHQDTAMLSRAYHDPAVRLAANG